MKTIKQLLITLAVLLCSATASAYDFEVDGIYYKVLSLSDLTVEVTYGDNKYSGEVIIPSTVSYKSKALTVTSIGNSAFNNSTGLTSVVIPNSVTNIGRSAFYGCDGLTSVTIPNSVTSIGNYAFYKCSGLTSIEIPNSVTSISSDTFYGCSGLTSITIPNSVTSIGDRAFYNCTSLKDLRIEDGETTLWLGYNNYHEGLFYDCPLESLYLGRNIQYNTGKDYGYSPFFGNKTLKSVTIGNSVTSIRDYAFEDCSGLTSVTIGNSVTSIGESAFRGCSSLKTVVNLSNLKIRYIGSTSYGYVGYYADKVINAPNGTIEGDFVFGKVNGNNTLCGYIGNDIELSLPDNYKGENYVIGGSAFHGCDGLTSVTIPNSVTSIGNYAFEDCSGLTSVTIGNSVTSIGESAFYGCTGLTSVVIPNSVTNIGRSAFYGCDGLTSVTIPNSVTSIGNYAFYKCSGLTSIEIPNSVTSIGESAFYDCNSLTSVTIGNSVTSIGESAFRGCDGLTSIHLLGETPPTVGSNNFTNKQYLNMIVYVPKGTLATYQAADTWKDFWDIQEFDVTAIENIEDVPPAFEITSSGIQFTAADCKAVAIYTANGALVEKIDCYVGEEITLDKGVYIVRVGNKTMKVKL